MVTSNSNNNNKKLNGNLKEIQDGLIMMKLQQNSQNLNFKVIIKPLQIKVENGITNMILIK